MGRSNAVGGDWIASNVSAGYDPGADTFFGTADDVHKTLPYDDTDIIFQIASFTIRGQVKGTANTGDHFGLVAQRIDSLRVGGVSLGPVLPGNPRPLGVAGDFTARAGGLGVRRAREDREV